MKEGIEKMNSKSSPDKNYNQELNIKNSFLEQQNSFLKQEIISKQNINDKLFDIQSDQLKTNLIPKEKGDNTVIIHFYFKELLHLSIKLHALKIFKLNFPK